MVGSFGRSRKVRWPALCLGAVVVFAGCSDTSASPPGTGVVAAGSGGATPYQRADALVARLSLDQKLELMSSGKTGIPQFGIPPISAIDGPNGIGEGSTGVTAFPDAVNIGAAWNPALARQYGAVLGREARAKGHNLLLAPTLNIVRSPKWGRAAETYSEDPYLTSSLIAPEVTGIQSAHVMAEPKHYAGNNQEIGRVGSPVATAAINDLVSLRTLQEIYLPGFKAAVRKGGAASVMCSYNQINGSPSCQNATTLGLLAAFGLQGFVEPDAIVAVRDLVAAANAGVDNFQLGSLTSATGGPGAQLATLKSAVTAGTLSLSRVDDAVRRILIAMIRVGLIDTSAPKVHTVANSPAHLALAANISDQGTVLLQNRPVGVPTSATSSRAQGTTVGHNAPVLPLTPSDHSIAVIGYDAGSGTQIEEGGSPAVVPGKVVTPLAGIRARAPPGTKVTYSEGTRGVVPLPVVPSGVLTPSSGPGHGLSGTFFTSGAPTWSGPSVVTRTDPVLDFRSAPSPLTPIPGTTAQSGVWTGTLTPPTTGEYRFSLSFSGAATLTIGGNQVIDGNTEWVSLAQSPGAPDVAYQAVVDLAGGMPVPITVKYATDSSSMGADLHLGWLPPEPSLLASAVAAARAAQVAVVFVNDVTSEGMDRSSLALPGDQDHLIEAIAQANPRTVVVLHTASAVLMPWHNDVAAVVEAWYPGQQSGRAIARTLFGDVDPSGHLPVTFPADESQGPTTIPDRYPGVNGVAQYSEGLDVGYRFYDQYRQQPLFPFGYGLSYTSFSLSDLRVADRGSGHYVVTVRIRNTGARAGAQVVQLYVGFPSSAGEPPRQLKAFDKIYLQSGASGTVTLDLSGSSFKTFDGASNSWVTTAGEYTVGVGTSSQDLPLQSSITIG